MQALRSGMPAPAMNPFCRDKTYYRFFWAGILIVVGCLMPFDANHGAAGYQTVFGAIYLLIGLGMVRTWWGAINTNRSTGVSALWLLLCFVPLVGAIMNMVFFDADAAYRLAAERGHIVGEFQYSQGWAAMFEDIVSAMRQDFDAAARAGNFWRLLGTGNLFLLFGGLIAELGFAGGIMGGAKQNKQMKQEKQKVAADKKKSARARK